MKVLSDQNNWMPKVGGKAFRCECGCNVFSKPDATNPDLYECNSCEAHYAGESVDAGQSSQTEGAECATPVAHLNEAQQAAVEAREPLVIVPASPGAGKTRVLVERVRSLIADGADPKLIICLTYTNAGAREITSRLPEIQLGFIGTLHAYCLRLLQDYGYCCGFPHGVTLTTEEVAEELFRETVATMGWKGSLKQARESKDRKADLVRRAYRDALKRSGMADYDTLLEEALAFLQGGQVPFYSDLLVDETQDSAVIDWRIYDAIHADRKFWTGDNDQSLFSFRGAMPHLFVERCERPDHVVIPLEQNYRSDQFICERANRLIRHNRNRVAKLIVPISEAVGAVEIHHHMDHIYEQRAVAGWVRQRFEEGTPWHEIAVLIRTNDLVQQFHVALEAMGIPLMRPESIDLPPDWSRALDILGLWLNPASDILAKRVLGRLAQWAKMRDQALAKGAYLTQIAIELGLFVPAPALDQIPEAMARLNVERSTVELLRERIEALPQRNLSDLAADLFALTRVPLKPDRSGVFCGTIHSSKGLEFDAVALPAWEEGMLPSGKRDEDIEDHRRLAYVGITRARHHLLISHAAKRDTKFKKGIEAPRSRFIDEIELVAESAKLKETL